jgi:stearoyl-CoA desaturase (delta-9 desaturase)
MTLDFLYGVLQLNFWGYALAAFLMVQFTFMGVTLYLHRDATHRSLDLHPALRHVFRFWLWMSSGMLTREWVAVHRKHHARCETADDPHSPVIYGLKKVLLQGAELYKEAAHSPGMLEKYGRGAPDDWIERRLYQRHRALGIVLMVVLDLVLFGVPGIIIIAVQMLAIPVMAAGVINGLGHHTGYRNFECPDAARNIVPWGLLVAGEELHNNHHAFPAAAKFSVRPWEFDMGWLYIRVLQFLRLAEVRRLAPVLVRVPARSDIDVETLRAVLINRMHVIREYAKRVTVPVCKNELGEVSSKRVRAAKVLLVRNTALLDGERREHLGALLAGNVALRTVHDFRERLNALWSRAHTDNEGLLRHLREWIADAEASSLPLLRHYAQALRGAGLPVEAGPAGRSL